MHFSVFLNYLLGPPRSLSGLEKGFPGEREIRDGTGEEDVLVASCPLLCEIRFLLSSLSHPGSFCCLLSSLPVPVPVVTCLPCHHHCPFLFQLGPVLKRTPLQPLSPVCPSLAQCSLRTR